jgi:DMSO/TMAO reductase YedYZ molybdopterin-dependent catalytic subunit
LFGIALGVSFTTCFVTGLISHFMQHNQLWAGWISRPVWFYRLTQGLHVATGLATIPLLGAKLWTVYPKLWEWPPIRSAAHALERVSIVPLIAGSIFQLATGVANIAEWYRFRFYFTAAHYWVAWITLGALAVHVAAKITVVRASLGPARPATGPPRTQPPRAEQPRTEQPRTEQPEAAGGGLSRRGFVVAVGAAAGTITLTTAGEATPGLARVDLLAPRRPDVGPSGLPVNRTAAAARVTVIARDPAYRLDVVGPRPFSLSLAELTELAGRAAHASRLPITCVEGWSADARWTGVRLRDLLDRAGIPAGTAVRVESLERAGAYRASEVNPSHARDPLTLIATGLNGAPLTIDHGYPARLIAPNRPGVLQTKWVHKVVAL